MGSFKDDRLHLVFQDSFEYLAQSPETYDIVVVDVPDPLEGGPAVSMFTKEFYEQIVSKLNPNGMMVSQCGPTNIYSLNECFTPAANTIKYVFPTTFQYHVHIPSFGTTWGFVMGSNSLDPSKLSTHEIDARLRSRIENKLGFYDGVTHTGMFNIPKYLRESINKETRVITESNPLFVP